MKTDFSRGTWLGELRGSWPALPWIAALTLLLATSTSATAAEAPRFEVGVDTLTTVDTITAAELGGARAHLNFPFMKRHANGDLVITYVIGQTQSGQQAARQAISTDGGINWSQQPVVPGDAAGAQLIRPAGQLSQSFGVYYENPTGFTSWNNNGRYRSFDGGSTWDSGTDIVTYNTSGVPYTVMSHSYEDVLETSGTLYMAQFGQRVGASAYESVLMVSTNGGKNWSRRSTIAQHTSSQTFGQMGSEGPTETGLLRLDNGNLLAVFRTGQPFPNTEVDAVEPSLFWSISNDSGFNWSPAKTLGTAGVFPQLRKLEDGSVALSYGRYGAKLLLADPTGTRWAHPTVIHDGPSSGHTDLRPVGNGKYVYVYDQSGFYPPPWNDAVPAGFVYDNNQSGNLLAAVLDIDVKPTVDDVPWTFEYHGDVAPSSLPVPWTLAQTGAGNVRFWADQAQDFLRIDTSPNGASKTLAYTLSAATPGSAWQPVDFGAGMVMEFRARVAAGSTSEGAANIFIGDGSNGSVSVELDGTGISLEGLGGNAAQQEYQASAHPGFSTLDWHDYRLVVRPDASLNGGILASLFLDDLASPILARQLQAGTFDELRIGDLAGGSNGIFDIDYLRFASIPTEAIWASNVSGNWGEGNHWLAGDAPDGVGETVLLGAGISQPQTLYMDTNVSLTELRFRNSESYAVAGQGTLSFTSATGVATLDVDLGSHQFQAQVTLEADLNADIAADSSIAFNNRLDLNGHTLTKTGAGTLIVNNVLETNGGVVQLAVGTVSGAGFVAGSFDSQAGVLSPGNSPGLFEISGDYSQGALATLRLEIGGDRAIRDYDRLSIGGLAELAGSLELVLIDGFQPSMDQRFDLLDWAGFTGNFDRFRLPTLIRGLAWDLSSLYVDGSVSIAATVPEPNAVAMVVVVAIACGWTQRRRQSINFRR